MKRRAALPLLILAPVAAWALPPQIRDISPHGAQRGKTVTLYLRGEGLVRGAQVKSTLPAAFNQLTLSKDPLSESGAVMKPDSVLAFLLTVPPETPTGFYPVRVLAPGGVSNAVLFAVGDLPEVEELESKEPKKPNNFAAEAQKLSTPTVVTGSLNGADLDCYSFQAKAGQKLVFEVEARRMGSGIDPAIEITDATGKVLAKSEDAPGLGVDARVEVAFPRLGEYQVRIHDSKFSDQTQNFYRLKIGSWQYADTVFPLGGQRGSQAEFTLSGGNLPQPVKVTADLNTKQPLAELRVAGSSAPPTLVAVGDVGESGEVARLVEKSLVNGRIATPGEVDRYKLAVEPGEQWFFEIQAAALGTSALDGLITVYDAAGKKLASGDDLAGADPVLAYTVPAGLREVTVAVEDVLGRGGPAYGYRLTAIRQQADFLADLATPFVNVPAGGSAQVVCVIQRRGYDGEIKVRIQGLPPGFEVAGGNVPNEAAAQNFSDTNAGRRTARAVLTITAPPDAKPVFQELTVVAEAHTQDGVLRRIARSPGIVNAIRGDRQRAFTAVWLAMPLTMASAEPLPVTIEGPGLLRFTQGFEFDYRYRVRRRDGARVPSRPNFKIEGAVGNLRILRQIETKDPDAGSYQINTNFATPVSTFDVLIEAQVEHNGQTFTVTSPVTEVQIVPGYEVQLARSNHEITPGGKLEIAGRVRRELTFEGAEIKVDVLDLPDGVRCSPALVPADVREFILRCEASGDAKAGTQAIRIASAAPDTGRKAKAEYKIADLNARIVVSSPASAAGRD